MIKKENSKSGNNLHSFTKPIEPKENSFKRFIQMNTITNNPIKALKEINKERKFSIFSNINKDFNQMSELEYKHALIDEGNLLQKSINDFINIHQSSKHKGKTSQKSRKLSRNTPHNISPKKTMNNLTPNYNNNKLPLCVRKNTNNSDKISKSLNSIKKNNSNNIEDVNNMVFTNNINSVRKSPAISLFSPYKETNIKIISPATSINKKNTNTFRKSKVTKTNSINKKKKILTKNSLVNIGEIYKANFDSNKLLGEYKLFNSLKNLNEILKSDLKKEKNTEEFFKNFNNNSFSSSCSSSLENFSFEDIKFKLLDKPVKKTSSSKKSSDTYKKDGPKGYILSKMNKKDIDYDVYYNSLSKQNNEMNSKKRHSVLNGAIKIESNLKKRNSTFLNYNNDTKKYFDNKMRKGLSDKRLDNFMSNKELFHIKEIPQKKKIRKKNHSKGKKAFKKRIKHCNHSRILILILKMNLLTILKRLPVKI